MRKVAKTNPVVRKGATFPFQVAVVAWTDLLGYGAMIADADFNPLHPKAAAAISRLRSFHGLIAASSSRAFPTLVMNDGAAAYHDISLRNRSVTYQFVMNSWSLFNTVNKTETNTNYPGARMVIAAGFRMRGRRAGIDQTKGHFGSLMERFEAGKISAVQAIQEAARIRPSFDILPQLQANFAFTKAYVAESNGRAGGLAGAKCFIDLALFDDPPPPWIELGPAIEWRNDALRLSASFAPVLRMPHWKHAADGPLGIRDGLQVAQHLAGEADVLRALREAPRLSSRS
jgi:hypothetical protein